MEFFEYGETNMLQFMTCLEDILGYIDNFTCGHALFLDVPIERKIINTCSKFEFRPSAKEHQQRFEIKRTQNNKVQQLIVHLTLQADEECRMVNKCSIYGENAREDNIIDRASMRDFICSFFVPGLRVFPILDLLIPTNMNEVSLPPSVEMPLFGFKVECKNNNEIFIYLNSDDQIVTSLMKEDASLDTWNFIAGVKNNIFDKDVFMFVSYIIASVVD